jgi:hypothetical protein
MSTGTRRFADVSIVSTLLAATLLFQQSISRPAVAQASGMVGIGQSDTIVARAIVKAIDLPSRMVTLVGSQGDTVTVKVGDEVRNLPQVKPGNQVLVRYHGSVTYVLSPRGAKLPKDSLVTVGTRATPGQMPAGAVAAKLVVTETVVGVDPASHTLQVVNPSGGMVETVAVTTPEGQQNKQMIKVGDTITAIVPEAVAVAVEPTA